MADISSLQSVQSNHEKYKDLFKNSGKNDTISTDTFFSLLMAEMSNQDPLEPTSIPSSCRRWHSSRHYRHSRTI